MIIVVCAVLLIVVFASCSRWLGIFASVASVIIIASVYLAFDSSSFGTASKGPSSLESIYDLTSSLRKRPRTDLDPGSLQGLVQAAENGGSKSNDDDSTRSRLWARRGMKHVNGPALTLQQHETTQRRIERNLRAAHKLKRSLGSTIARYFSTVRSVKDDQGTFLG
jgi:hypothetical protein